VSEKELPQGWAQTNLSTIARRIDYGYTASSDETANGPRFLRITDLQNGRVNWDSVPRCECDAPTTKKYELSAGDLVIARTGATTGKAFLVRQVPESSVFASYLIRVRTLPAVAPEFLEAFTNSPNYWKQITEVKKGTAQPGANASILGGLSLPLPPLNEQRRIVAKLEDLLARSRRAKDALEAIPPLLEKLRQSILAAAFRGDLTADWRAKNPDVEPAEELLKRIRVERRKKWEEAELAKLRAKGKAPTDDRWKAKYQEPEPVDTEGVPELPEGWAWASWREIGFSQNGRAFPSTEYLDIGVPLLRPGNLHASGEVKWTSSNTKCLDERWAEEFPEHVVSRCELVINLTAQSLKDEFLGRVCMTGENERCLLNQRIGRLTPVLLEPRFVLWLFKSPEFRTFVDGLNSGSLIQHMFTSQIDEFAIRVPPLPEQREIAKRLDRAASVWLGAQRRLDSLSTQLDSLDGALLSKAFRGELVEQDPNDEPASVMLEHLAAERATDSSAPKKGEFKKAASGKSKRRAG
jgi:type I restriction enzyme S subunit